MALERSNKDLEDFAHAASHDLQEPLRSIVGFLQLLHSRYGDLLDEIGKFYITRSVEAGRRMQSMIKDLLALSRVDTKGGSFKIIDLNRIAEEVLEDLHSILERKNADISLDALPSLRADAGQICSLLQNQIANALKYNKSSRPSVRIGCREQGNYFEFSVQDNGIGIPP